MAVLPFGSPQRWTAPGGSPGHCAAAATFRGCQTLSSIRYVSCSSTNLSNGGTTCENKKIENHIVTKATTASTSTAIGGMLHTWLTGKSEDCENIL